MADGKFQLSLDSRRRIINKIAETLERNMPLDVEQRLETKLIAEAFEEKVYVAATSQSDYLRVISLKMLQVESKKVSNVTQDDPIVWGKRVQDQMLNQMNAATPGEKPATGTGDWRVHLQPVSRQIVVEKLVETFMKLHPIYGQGRLELKQMAEHFEDKIYTTATSQSDYMGNIFSVMLKLEIQSQNTMPSFLQYNLSGNNGTLDRGGKMMALQPQSTRRPSSSISVVSSTASNDVTWANNHATNEVQDQSRETQPYHYTANEVEDRSRETQPYHYTANEVEDRSRETQLYYHTANEVEDRPFPTRGGRQVGSISMSDDSLTSIRNDKPLNSLHTSTSKSDDSDGDRSKDKPWQWKDEDEEMSAPGTARRRMKGSSIRWADSPFLF